MMPEVRALMEHIKTDKYRRRANFYGKTYMSRAAAEAAADAEFVIKWRKKQKRLSRKK